MSKLVYGKNGQVVFSSESEKKAAIEYLLNSPNVNYVHEHNEEQGAWASEYRFHILNNDSSMPDGVRNNLTAGHDGIYGRINCKELYLEIVK